MAVTLHPLNEEHQIHDMFISAFRFDSSTVTLLVNQLSDCCILCNYKILDRLYIVYLVYMTIIVIN